MPMQLVTARRYPRKVVFAVHLDTTRTVVDDKGATVPDPEWVLTQEYPLGKGERRTAGEAAGAYGTRVRAFLANIRTDMRARCDARLADLIDETDPGVALPGEGTVF